MPYKPEKRYLYNAWHQMLARCEDPEHPAYKSYGERGIHVCEPWRQSFDAFIRDVGPRPSSDHTLDRIDNEKGYCPDNVRWATQKEQGNNRRTNRRVTFQGRTQTVTQWAEELFPENVGRIKTRFAKGWDTERALTTPVRPKRKNGQAR